MAIDPGATRAPADSDPAARIHERLKVYFAMISCLGGLVLGTEPQTESLPAIAIFFAVFGYVFVDWLRLFALPSIAAYAAMGLAALYCVSDFAELEGQGNHQIVVVAELLVMVQAILMLQTKTRRIFEQLGVFCLLQLVVAAVFNDAISYGLFLIPISVIGAWALSLLAAASALEPPSKRGSGEPATVPPIRCSAVSAQRSLVGASGRLPRIALWGIAPAAALVSAVFFYALPRTTDAAHLGERGDTLVGFRDEVRLEQFGEMLRSSKPAMRVKLTDARTGRNYRAVGGIYLRGRVLERYQAAATSEMSTAIWFATTPGSADATGRLPTEYVPRRASDKNFYDTVKARIKCESMGSSSLFAIAPYHRVAGRHGIEHLADRWTLRRRADQPPEMSLSFPRIEYAFGTHAFHRGVQSELVARRSVRGAIVSTAVGRPGPLGPAGGAAEDGRCRPGVSRIAAGVQPRRHPRGAADRRSGAAIATGGRSERLHGRESARTETQAVCPIHLHARPRRRSGPGHGSNRTVPLGRSPRPLPVLRLGLGDDAAERRDSRPPRGGLPDRGVQRVGSGLHRPPASRARLGRSAGRAERVA